MSAMQVRRMKCHTRILHGGGFSMRQTKKIILVHFSVCTIKNDFDCPFFCMCNQTWFWLSIFLYAEIKYVLIVQNLVCDMKIPERISPRFLIVIFDCHFFKIVFIVQSDFCPIKIINCFDCPNSNNVFDCSLFIWFLLSLF